LPTIPDVGQPLNGDELHEVLEAGPVASPAYRQVESAKSPPGRQDVQPVGARRLNLDMGFWIPVALASLVVVVEQLLAHRRIPEQADEGGLDHEVVSFVVGGELVGQPQVEVVPARRTPERNGTLGV
jgi:hypothetical protein